MRAKPARNQPSALGTTRKAFANTLGTQSREATKTRRDCNRSVKNKPIVGACTTCMEMRGNGAAARTPGLTEAHPSETQPGTTSECYAEEVGKTTRGTADLRIAAARLQRVKCATEDFGLR